MKTEVAPWGIQMMIAISILIAGCLILGALIPSWFEPVACTTQEVSR